MIASLILLFHFLGVISIESTYTSLAIVGVVLIIAEFGIISFGLLALNGMLALYAAYALRAGHETILGLSVDWQLFFGVVFTEAIIITAFIIALNRMRTIKKTVGTESMVNQKATILEWDKTAGKVRYEGEIWNAVSNADMELNKNDEVTIESVDKLVLKITA